MAEITNIEDPIPYTMGISPPHWQHNYNVTQVITGVITCISWWGLEADNLAFWPEEPLPRQQGHGGPAGRWWPEGDTGPQGERGAMGPLGSNGRGRQGRRGRRGLRGRRGAPGPPGPPGAIIGSQDLVIAFLAGVALATTTPPPSPPSPPSPSTPPTATI